jgi:hypothetical protein
MFCTPLHRCQPHVMNVFRDLCALVRYLPSCGLGTCLILFGVPVTRAVKSLVAAFDCAVPMQWLQLLSTRDDSYIPCLQLLGNQTVNWVTAN